MFSLPVVTWIGNAAAVLSGQWGAVSQRARDVGCSREAMYRQARRVEQAVAEEQAGGPSREELLAENQRLRDENRTLWALLEEAESLSKALQQKFAATASAMGLSLTQIIKLLAIVLPPRCVPSRATVGRWVEQSSSRAGRILKVLDRACQAWVLTLCLDEIFFHREPVLVAVEPASLAWVAGQRGPDRTGASWCRLLQQWPGLERVVSDAGPGLARGVKLLNEARAAAAAAEAEPPALAPVQVGLAGQRGPDRTGASWCRLLQQWPGLERVVSDAGTGLARGIKLLNEARAAEAEAEPPAVAPVQVGLDVFHTEREMQRIVGRRWAQVEKLLEAAAKAEQQVEDAKRRGIDARGAAARARAAWGKAERAFDAAVQVEAAVERIKAALALVRPDGQLNDRTWAQQQITDALGELAGKAWSKVRRLLNDVRTLNHLDWMHGQLAQAVPDPLLREAVVRLWYWRGQVGRTHGTQQAHAVQMVVMEQLLCRRLSSDWPLAYARVGYILTHTVRASSAVECMNSVLRMHQARHRRVSQGMLDLKRLFWNCRTFTHGKRRGAYPYQLLGLRLPTDDWWGLLQMDPEELEQKLSIQEVMV